MAKLDKIGEKQMNATKMNTFSKVFCVFLLIISLIFIYYRFLLLLGTHINARKKKKEFIGFFFAMISIRIKERE